MFLKMRFLKFENWKYFNYSHRRPWALVLKEAINFCILCIMFSISFALIEKSTLGHENFIENFGDSLYYLFTSLTTIGYGDLSPKTPLGKLLFIFFICLFGVYKMVSMVEMIISAKQFKQELKSKGRLFMPIENHVIVFFDADCVSKYNFLFIERFIDENLKSNKFKNSKLMLVNCNKDYISSLSLFLQEKNYFNDKVILINADIYEQDILTRIELNKAKHIYVLGSIKNDMISDSKVIDTINRIRKHGYKSNNISAELIDDNMRDSLRANGVETIIRPTRSYPELLIRATVAEGSEKMLEELLSSKGDSIATFRIKCPSFVWGELLYKLSMSNIGTLMAYINNEGIVDSNPKGGSFITDVDKILIMIENLENKDYKELESLINNEVLNLNCNNKN